MPELHAKKKRPFNYYRNYFRTYVERDVRRLINVKNLIQFERFVTLLAGRVGQVVNFTSLANETGVSVPTISAWLSALEASFLVFRLPPHFANVAKRVVKAPKIYFTDVGLASSDAQTNSSNSITQPSSSASHPVPPSVDCQMDSTGLRVIMCHDDGRGMIASMVSTYDISEII